MVRKKCYRNITHNKGKPVIAERFIIIVKNKTYKCMAAISKNVYINKLNDVVNKYSNTCHSTIKIKPADVKSTTYIDSSKEINNKSPKLKIGDTVRIAKYSWRNWWNILWKKIANQKEFRTQKIIKRKGDKLYVKWEGYSNSFICWTNKKDSVNKWIFSRTEIFRKSESSIRFA